MASTSPVRPPAPLGSLALKSSTQASPGVSLSRVSGAGVSSWVSVMKALRSEGKRAPVGRPIQSSSFYSTLFSHKMEHKTWMCLICGWIYDEALGDTEHGIAPGTKWEDVPMNWTCPECAARKEDFEMVAL